jgi:SAM-dependent methyltransferase
MTCPCCAHPQHEPLFRVRDQQYVACTRCRSAWLEPPPAFDPTSFYGEHYFVHGDDRGGYRDYEADGPLHRRNARARVRFVAPYLPPRQPADAIDVGCASGYALEEYAQHHLRPHGVDVSPWARQRVTARGFDAHATLTGAIGASPALVLVSFFQSLEHMADPDAAVAEAADALPSGGVVAIETWDRLSRIARLSGSRWQQANPPSVLHLFTREGIQRLAERHGLRIERMQATSKVVSPSLAVGVVKHRAPRALGAVEKVLDATHLAHVAVPYKLGDLMTVVAVKR